MSASRARKPVKRIIRRPTPIATPSLLQLRARKRGDYATILAKINGFRTDGTLASRKSLVTRLATIVDVCGLRLGAVGEFSQQVKDLRVAVLLDEPLDVVSTAAPAWLTNDCQGRSTDIREGEGVFRHRARVARRRERNKNDKGPLRDRECPSGATPRRPRRSARERCLNQQHRSFVTGFDLIFAPLGTFEGKPTEGGQADAPKQSYVHHHFLFTELLRIF
jgi:hypothetical protein